MRVDPGTMHETLTWALGTETSGDWAIADLMARELEPASLGAVDLLTSGHATLETLVRAKAVFKTMRLEGETADDRRLGAQLYAAAIGAALVHFSQKVSRQRADSLGRAFRRIAEDLSLPPPLRTLAARAHARLRSTS